MRKKLSVEERRRRASDLGQLLVSLAALFPAAFVVGKYQVHAPLKIGIHIDIAARCPELADRLGLLRGYTGRLMYLQAMVAGAVRVDLDGNPSGEVTDAQAASAAAWVTAMLAARAATAAATKVAAAQVRAARALERTKAAAAAKAAAATKAAEATKAAAAANPANPITTSIPERRLPASPNSTKPTLKLPFMRSATKERDEVKP